MNPFISIVFLTITLNIAKNPTVSVKTNNCFFAKENGIQNPKERITYRTVHTNRSEFFILLKCL